VIVDSDTGASRDLTTADTAALWPAWSPDGRIVACFAAPDADAAYKKAMAGVNIRVMRPDGSVTTQLVTPATNISAVGGGEEAHAYLQQRKIWFLDPTGVNPPRQITSDPKYRDEAPLWSADGSHLLFGRMDYDGHASLWLMDSNGANLKQICPLKIHDDLLDKDSWFGFYGYTDWRSAFDWRRI
jgi:Tol biopolymer transport system component